MKRMKSPDPLEEQRMKELGSIRDRGIFGWALIFWFAADANLQHKSMEVHVFQGQTSTGYMKYIVFLVSGDSWWPSLAGMDA